MNSVPVQMALSLILGAVFVVSSTPKLRHPKSFLLTVLEFRILPSNYGRIYARTLPILELLAGLMLLTGTSVRLAALLSITLLTSFMASVAVNLTRGRSLECGCFGSSKRPISGSVLIQDGLLVACAISLYVLTPRWFAPTDWSPLSRIVGEDNSAFVVLAAFLLAAGIGAVAQRPNLMRRDKGRTAASESVSIIKSAAVARLANRKG